MSASRSRRGGYVVAVAVLTLAAATGCRGGSDQADAAPGSGDAVTAAAQPSISLPPSVRDFRSTRELPAVPAPQRLRIPQLGVDTTLELLGAGSDRKIEVPRNWQRAGWYRNSPRPGEPGSAVILGHVDSPTGPAVFRGLATLTAGNRVVVDRADGSTVTFRVTRVVEVLRAEFPMDEVYLPTLNPELRLITCSGRYIRSRGGYQSNVIVFATAERSSVRLE